MNCTANFALPKFPVDGGSLIAWCASNVTGYVSAIVDAQLKIVTSDMMEKAAVDAVNAYIATLTQQGEATKLALPHNLSGQAKVTFENSVKAVIASKTFDQLTAAQKTFFMGGTLSNSDYDSLPTS